ncbi:MAG: hypothetical protein ACM3ZT_04150 [Bacillota bacterium]
MTKLTLACGLILILAACASNSPAPGTASAAPAPAAGTSVAATAATKATAQATKPKLVCEEEKPLGSLLPQRICMTPEEAAKRRKAAQDAMRNIQNSGNIEEKGGSSGG